VDDPDPPSPRSDSRPPARLAGLAARFQRLRRSSQARLLGGLTLGTALGVSAPPVDLRLVGRTLLHAALVGLGAGLVGAAFFVGLEYTQHALLGHLGGYIPLRAHGERLADAGHAVVLRPLVVMLLPPAGALLAGLLCQLAPETRGGGGDATIHAFHHQGGVVRRRVIWIKAVASILTLGTGGSGGREGPTMQIGASLGSTVGRWLRVDPRERRILMLAGVAAGMAAVFRTPLGAALLAAEVVYRDDFEAEALVPAILASVVAYSIVISMFGESTLFARAPRYFFIPRHLPLYAALAVLIALAASSFLAALRAVQHMTARLPVPVWLRPACGGLALSLFAVPLILIVGTRFGTPGHALGVLGGGYGAAQVALTGADWLPGGWRGAELLLFLALAKLVATSFTIGSGGSAGDFGPSLVLGGLFGGAFGRAAAVLLHDPSIDPGAFALVGMGTFYGGLAHVPVSSLIMVSELAGSYDLLVPLMLAEAIAFVALRRRFLYDAQVPTHADSPVHRPAVSLNALSSLRVADVMAAADGIIRFEPRATMADMARALGSDTPQFTFPVVDATGRVVGVVSAPSIRALMTDAGMQLLAVAADIMQTDAQVSASDQLGKVMELTHSTGLRQLPVVDENGRLLGMVDESNVTRAYLTLLKASPAEAPAT